MIYPYTTFWSLGNPKRYCCWVKRCRKNAFNLKIASHGRYVFCANKWCKEYRDIEQLENQILLLSLEEFEMVVE
tara:strand:+ start:1932 stop:2153 length:222 start_codon:yes stop_codon:yes gene_type:complete